MSEHRAPGTALQMLFLPITRAEAALLRDGRAVTDRAAHAATPALLRAHAFDHDSLEDAEFTALTYAGVHAVLETVQPGGLRLVLAAEVPASDATADPGDPYGQVRVRQLRWTSVRALFADEPAARAALALAVTEAAGLPLAEAVALPAVDVLVDEHDLLWFAPEELDHLP